MTGDHDPPLSWERECGEVLGCGAARLATTPVLSVVATKAGGAS